MTRKPVAKPQNKEGELCAFDGCSRRGRYTPEIVCPQPEGDPVVFTLYIKVCKDHSSSTKEHFAGKRIWPRLVEMMEKEGLRAPPYSTVKVRFEYVTDAGIIIPSPIGRLLS